MNTIKDLWLSIKQWVVAHPKQFYIYSMGLILLSGVFSILQYMLFPPEPLKIVAPRTSAGKPDITVSKYNAKMNEMGQVVRELQIYKSKRDKMPLNHADSVRIEFLINQYNKLKNDK